jgi:DNA-binding beta-propeller fold protein YncE
LAVAVFASGCTSAAARKVDAAATPAATQRLAATAPSAARSIPTSPASSATVPPSAAAAPSWPPRAPADELPELAAGSDPAALPAPVLIADRDNNRLVVVSPRGQVLWQWPQSGDLAPGQTFRVPDDAFFTPDGKHIVVTQEDDFVITEIDIATRKIVWRYGVPGVHGSGPNRLWNPDDAMMLADGSVIAADIKNCRLVRLGVAANSPLWTAGAPAACRHSPPTRYGSPNGVFPLPNGHYLVTEINHDWVDEIDLTGHVYWSAHPPQVSYPSDTSQLSAGEYVTADYSSVGQVVVFDAGGHTVWRWRQQSGAGRLNHPSLAEGMPNGDIILNDDRNHRVIVINPRVNRIVWQYGHTAVRGTAPGYLSNPDGLDLVPPHSFADRVMTGAS